MQREYFKLVDERSLDVIYAEQMHQVGLAMYEPEPAPIDKAVAAIWSGYGLFLIFLALMVWEMMR